MPSSEFPLLDGAIDRSEIAVKDSSLPSVGAKNLPRYYSHLASGNISACPLSRPPSQKDVMISRRRKELFGDCALIEIIHLHDCLRGALQALQEDVVALTKHMILDNDTNHGKKLPSEHQVRDIASWSCLEGRVAGRFKVIWSVFRAHSSAEDEFIWPALRSKMQTETSGPCSGSNDQRLHCISPASSNNRKDSTCGCGSVMVQGEYEEDHADEERMFSDMDQLLKQLRDFINDERQKQPTLSSSTTTISIRGNGGMMHEETKTMANQIFERTRVLTDHLMKHLEKEETQCMPLVVKHLSKAEIHDLVGNIMGKRSADTIAQIMTMAVQSLPENERQEMIQYMKQSMQNTFFDRWLLASGWGQINESKQGEALSPVTPPVVESTSKTEATIAGEIKETDREIEVTNRAVSRKRSAENGTMNGLNLENVHTTNLTTGTVVKKSRNVGEKSLSTSRSSCDRPLQITSQAELEKLIRAIATNPALSAQQKNSTIQGLRDSVWKSNQREKERSDASGSPPVVPVNDRTETIPFLALHQQSFSSEITTTTKTSGATAVTTSGNSEAQQRSRSHLPPTAYYKRRGKSAVVELVWKNDGIAPCVSGDSVPLFSATELAPSFHDGAAGAVFGCPHYARAVKLRHPKSGRLYTCRLCCDQARELPSIRGGTQDEKLDRYAVCEVMCMVCNTLQPAEDRCINPDCESAGKPFAKYFCRICHLYDDGSRPIFHCPYCNTCRLGLGLGIDYRHCMRCNACVSLENKEHQCIPQKLQGTCPICHDSLFQSTEPLRGLKCGHVMHMKCFTQYRNSSYTCPLCMRSMEDMKDHWALLDAAIRMQPMPASFLHTFSNIYCQDCGKTGQVQYHFVGQKCPCCSSYNTREMGRVHNTSSAT